MEKGKKQKISEMLEKEMISNVILPDSIIEDILSRLHVKPLGRFRCVSKSWNTLLRDPHFVHMHLSRSKQTTTNIKLMLSSDDPSGVHVRLDQAEFSVDIRFCDIHVYGSCNGLVLLCQGSPTRGEKMLLLNPTTGECKNIPVPASEYIEGEFSSIVRYGLSYSESSKDYKIVRIISYDDSRGRSTPAEVTIYSSVNNLWKKVCATGTKDAPYGDLSIMHLTGVHVNGYLHWIADDSDYNVPVKYKITAFGFESECFRDVLYPPSFGGSEWPQVSSLDGNLCLGIFCVSKWQIWVMREYGLVESWTQLFSIKTELLDNEVNEDGDNTIRVLCLTKQGEDVLLRLEDELRLYNIKNERMQHIFRFPRSRYDTYRATPYIESLLPPGKGIPDRGGLI